MTNDEIRSPNGSTSKEVGQFLALLIVAHTETSPRRAGFGPSQHASRFDTSMMPWPRDREVRALCGLRLARTPTEVPVAT